MLPWCPQPVRHGNRPKGAWCGDEAWGKSGHFPETAPRNSGARQPRERAGRRTLVPKRGGTPGLVRYSAASAGGSFRCSTKVSSRSNLPSTRATRSLNIWNCSFICRNCSFI